MKRNLGLRLVWFQGSGTAVYDSLVCRALDFELLRPSTQDGLKGQRRHSLQPSEAATSREHRPGNKESKRAALSLSRPSLRGLGSRVNTEVPKRQAQATHALVNPEALLPLPRVSSPKAQ